MAKNILIGKIGKSIKMQDIHMEKGGGTDIVLYSTMARMNPDFNFYYGGPNDLDKLSKERYDYMFPNHNVFSIFKRDTKCQHFYEPMLEYVKSQNIKFDFALLFNGLCGTHNIPNFMFYEKTGKFYSPLMSFKNYAAPYIYLLNQLNIPLYLISEDARYVSIHAFDLYNRERLIFSQCNAKIPSYKHIKSDTDYSFVPVGANNIDCIYSGVEKIMLMGIKPNWKEQIDINAKLNSKPSEHLIVLSNGCGTAKFNAPAGSNSSRFPTYKEWIFEGLKGSPYEGTPVYGSWEKEDYEKYPKQIINKLIKDLKSEITNARYGFVYSMIPGFVTIKPYELIIMGLIPMLHPDYDKDHLLNLPEYCYCKDVQDFISKMEKLDADTELYKKILNECFDCILPEYLDGSYINNFIFTKISEDLGFTYENKQGVKSIFDRFSKDMLNHDLIKFEDKK